MGYAVVMGEALIDLLESRIGESRIGESRIGESRIGEGQIGEGRIGEGRIGEGQIGEGRIGEGRIGEGQPDGDLIYRQAIGGAPLNVAVGVTRLGGDVRYAGALSTDVLGDRIAAFLRRAGVGLAAAKRVTVPTTLAVTTFEGAEPTFTFYGEPPSYALLTPADLEPGLVAGASVLYAGSICLLREPFRSAARAAWQTAGPLRVFDPNVRPTLLPDAAAVAALRDLVEEFFATADLVKLSSADAEVLYDLPTPAAAADRILALGARAVVVTCGAKGAYVATAEGATMLDAPSVNAIDATGAGDSVMGALISRLLAGGRPAALDGWQHNVRFALAVAGLVCERPGGATAMPTMDELTERWGALLQQP